MRKIISITVKIICVILAFILLNSLFMPKYIEKNNDGRITAEYYREKTDIDVIITGSSTVQAGVSPMVLYRDYGITAYNRSNSSQTIAISYAMIADAIRQNKPSLVVCDLSFVYQPDDYVDEGSSRKSMDSLKWSKAKSECVKTIMDPTENYMDYVFPILRFHSRWNDLSMEDVKYAVYKPTVTHNGQLLQFYGLESPKERLPHMLSEDIRVTDRSMAYVQKIIDICRDNDVQLLFIKLPYIQCNWNETIEGQIAGITEANGVKYKNYLSDFDSIGFEDYTDFEDAQHMNSFGAEKFTQALGQFIKDNYDIKDSREMPEIKKVFDKKLERYENAMSNEIAAKE